MHIFTYICIYTYIKQQIYFADYKKRINFMLSLWNMFIPLKEQYYCIIYCVISPEVWTGVFASS